MAEAEHDGAVSCPHGERCGGCALLGVGAADQAARKRAEVSEALAAYPALSALPVTELTRAEPIVAYRSRAKLVVDRARVGLFASGSHEVVDIPGCRVLSPALLAVSAGLRELLARAAAGATGVDLREVDAGDGPQVLVTLIGAAAALPALRALATDVAALPHVASVAVAARDTASKTFFGELPELVVGPAALRDRLDPSLPFVLAAHGSFTQAHRGQAARLLTRTLQALQRVLGTLRGKRVLELYAGQGHLGLALATAGARVVLVERFAPALELLTEAAAAQTISAPETRTDDAARALQDLRDAGEPFDAVVVNPPRHGLPPAVRSGIARLGPAGIAYVSCAAGTLARDLAHFAQLGYRPAGVEPLDMLPLSDSVECFALLKPAPPPALPVLYEDAELLVIDKPPHLPTTPQGGRDDSLLARAGAERGGATLFAVHRLDQGTSGVCVLAKHGRAVHGLSLALAAGKKRYLALARGIARPKGIVRTPLVDQGVKHAATTRYTRLRVLGGHSLLRVRPEQGRTHQVRRHLAGLGHPVLGDGRHGDAASNRHFAHKHGLDRTFLHLHEVELSHPRTNAPLTFTAELAPDLRAVLDALPSGSGRARARRRESGKLPP